MNSIVLFGKTNGNSEVLNISKLATKTKGVMVVNLNKKFNDLKERIGRY